MSSPLPSTGQPATETAAETATTVDNTVATINNTARQTLQRYFDDGINSYNVDNVLDCFSTNITVTYPDPGRNWSGKTKGRIVLTGILGMMKQSQMNVTYEIIDNDDTTSNNNNNTGTADASSKETLSSSSSSPSPIILYTREDWSHSGRTIITKSKYTFSSDGTVIESMET